MRLFLPTQSDWNTDWLVDANPSTVALVDVLVSFLLENWLLGDELLVGRAPFEASVLILFVSHILVLVFLIYVRRERTVPVLRLDLICSTVLSGCLYVVDIRHLAGPVDPASSLDHVLVLEEVWVVGFDDLFADLRVDLLVLLVKESNGWVQQGHGQEVILIIVVCPAILSRHSRLAADLFLQRKQ
jgi:hypothetical protein